jgi:hypothetical protein
MDYKNDLTGQRFGRLVVIEYAGSHVSKNNSRTTMWKCKCDCGNIKDVSSVNLRYGTTRSCGCLHKEQLAALNRTHGLSGKKTRLYTIWKNMRRRCSNPNDKSYKNYGGRGISVCEEWDKNFEAFYKWSIENGYKEDIAESNRNRLSIDRINNDGNYEPSNCRWTNDYVQSSNKRTSLPPDVKNAICPICGKHYTKTSINGPLTCSYKCGCEYRKLTHPNTKDYTKICPVCNKLFDAKRGGHYKDAVCCSRECAKKRLSPVWEFNGESHNVLDWAEIVGVNAHCLHRRKEMGWTIEEILTTPLRGKRNATKL